MNQRRKTILICDDSPTQRIAVQSLIMKNDSYKILAKASNGEQAVQFAKLLRPDIVIMDIEMPKMNGIEAAIQIKNELPNVNVIMLSSTDDDFTVFKSFFSGADGFCAKNLISKLPSILQETLKISASASDRGSVAARSRIMAV